MSGAEEEIGTWFLIPLVESSNGQPHVVELWRCLRDEVYRRDPSKGFLKGDPAGG